MDTEKRKRPQRQTIRRTHLYGVFAFFSVHRDARTDGGNTQNALHLLSARSRLHHRLFPFGDFAWKKSSVESSVLEEAVPFCRSGKRQEGRSKALSLKSRASSPGTSVLSLSSPPEVAQW